MVVEKLIAPEDLAQENEDIRKRYPAAAETRAFRVSFFTKAFATPRGLATADSGDFLGYAIIKEDRVPSRGNSSRGRVYESVIRTVRHGNNFVRGAPEWTCMVAGNTLRLRGHIYAQQNNMTNVCAHVALRTVAAVYHPSGDMSYREMNSLVDVDHVNKKVGGPDGQGLTSDEMIRILEHSGARCFVGDYTKPKEWPVPFDKYIYGSVESGFPAVVIFQTTQPNAQLHAIPMIGHTFNEEAWVAGADLSYFRVGSGTAYIPSDSWLSSYIAHDDNWGSNYCIPRRYLSAKRVCRREGETYFCPKDEKGVSYVIGTVPRSVSLSPVRAEVIGADYLFTIMPQMPDPSCGWRERLLRYAKQRRLVLRPILIRGPDYAEHLSRVRDWHGHRIDPNLVTFLRKNLPTGHLWLIELSVPELFSANRRKIGEVLLSADVEPGMTRDLRSFLLARVPGHFALYASGGASNPKYSFVPCGADSHIELYG